MTDRVLVTGALGCIGAWTLYHLIQQGRQAISFDISDDRHRLALLMSHKEQAAITFVQGDLTAFDQLKAAFEQHQITHVIHLAALQVPACKANPVLGSQINVTGTINVFEAARQVGMKHVTYASSIAVYGPPEDYPPGLVAHNAPKLPRTLYGVYKVCNEMTAQIYWQDHQVSSTVLRPYTVYGVGRDQGLTSEPTKAMLAAAQGQDYHIPFGGSMQLHLASDMAQQFIEAALHPLGGAYDFNMGTPPVALTTVAALVMELCPGVTITITDNQLPFPEGCDSSALHQHFDHVYETPLREGIEQTIAHFKGS